MTEKWSTSDRATFRAGWISAAGAVTAAVIAAAVAIFVARGSPPATHPKPLNPPATASRARTPRSRSASGPQGRTRKETTFTQSRTFANFVSAGDPLGAPLSAGQSVEVSCRVRGFKVKDGDPWWYRLASSPWNGRFYATSDVFYNTGNISGNPINGVIVDKKVPVC